MTFKSKIDAWLVIFIAVALLAPPVLLFFKHDTARHPGISATTIAAIALAGMMIPAAFITWIFKTTEYTVTETDLLVRSGPVSEKIPLASIKRIRATRTILSAPALSLDRMEIQYGKYATIVISPEEKGEFVRAIQMRVPALLVEGIDF